MSWDFYESRKDICPLCGGHIDFYESEWDGEGFSYYGKCTGCEAYVEELYNYVGTSVQIEEES